MQKALGAWVGVVWFGCVFVGLVACWLGLVVVGRFGGFAGLASWLSAVALFFGGISAALGATDMSVLSGPICSPPSSL